MASEHRRPAAPVGLFGGIHPNHWSQPRKAESHLYLDLPLYLRSLSAVFREKCGRANLIEEYVMKRCLGLFIASLFFAVPMVVAQEHSDHAEVGVFADYFRFSDPGPTRNFVGLGGRAAFAIRSTVQIEAEMSYDFGRNYTSTFSNGFTTEVVNSQLHTLHGFFGPKFQTGSGPFRVFVTGKVGFDNFGVSGGNAGAGFVNTVGLTNGATYFALYPGGGVEAFAGPIGLRAEIGDDIFFNNGAHNNLRVTFGPQLRF
jgi:hypothetical protein